MDCPIPHHRLTGEKPCLALPRLPLGTMGVARETPRAAHRRMPDAAFVVSTGDIGLPNNAGCSRRRVNESQPFVGVTLANRAPAVGCKPRLGTAAAPPAPPPNWREAPPTPPQALSRFSAVQSPLPSRCPVGSGYSPTLLSRLVNFFRRDQDRVGDFRRATGVGHQRAGDRADVVWQVNNDESISFAESKIVRFQATAQCFCRLLYRLSSSRTAFLEKSLHQYP